MYATRCCPCSRARLEPLLAHRMAMSRWPGGPSMGIHGHGSMEMYVLSSSGYIYKKCIYTYIHFPTPRRGCHQHQRAEEARPLEAIPRCCTIASAATVSPSSTETLVPHAYNPNGSGKLGLSQVCRASACPRKTEPPRQGISGEEPYHFLPCRAIPSHVERASVWARGAAPQTTRTCRSPHLGHGQLLCLIYTSLFHLKMVGVNNG